jgi:hypothetical protein
LISDRKRHDEMMIILKIITVLTVVKTWSDVLYQLDPGREVDQSLLYGGFLPNLHVASRE